MDEADWNRKSIIYMNVAHSMQKGMWDGDQVEMVEPFYSTKTFVDILSQFVRFGYWKIIQFYSRRAQQDSNNVATTLNTRPILNNVIVCELVEDTADLTATLGVIFHVSRRMEEFSAREIGENMKYEEQNVME